MPHSEHESIRHRIGSPFQQSGSAAVDSTWDLVMAPTVMVMERTWTESLRPYVVADFWVNRPICGSFVDSPEVNACAIPGDKADHVFLYSGLVGRLLGYAWALCATREFLPNVGEASKEQALSQTHQFFSQHLDIKTGENLHVLPRCPIRGLIASLAVQFALQIALYHEIGHILGGHFALMAEGARVTGIDELASQRQDSIFEVPRGVIEWDADCFAANYSGFVQSNIRLANEVRQILARTVADPANDGMLLWALGGHLLFRVITLSRPDTYRFDPCGYPPPTLRAFNFLASILVRRAFMTRSDQTRDLEVVRLLGKLEQVCAGGVPPRVKDVWGTHIDDQRALMLQCFREHAPRLEQVTRTRGSWRPMWLV